jgi:hypothetical protein
MRILRFIFLHKYALWIFDSDNYGDELFEYYRKDQNTFLVDEEDLFRTSH